MGYRLPFFPVYAAETLADGRFQGWDLSERGAWLTLLCYAWNDGSIPASQTELARLLHLPDSGEMARLWSAIGDRFLPHPTEAGRLVSPRLEEERDHAEALGRIRSKAGEKGANARWDKAKPAHGKRMRLPVRPQCEGDGNAMANRCPIPSPSPTIPIRAQGPESPGPRVPQNGHDTQEGPSTTPGATGVPVPPLATGRMTRVALVSPYGVQDPFPKTTAVLAELWQRRIDAAPPSERSAARVEAAITEAGIGAATERLAAILPGARDKPLTYHVATIRGEKVAPPFGDLGQEAIPWPQRLTSRQAEAYIQERDLVAPGLAGAPIGIVGPNRELADLNARWKAIAEAEPP